MEISNKFVSNKFGTGHEKSLVTNSASRISVPSPQTLFAASNLIRESAYISTVKDTIVEAKTLEKIPFATKPLPQGGEIIYLTPDEFQEKFGFTYSESLYGNSSKLAKDFNNRLILSNIAERTKFRLEEDAIKERLNNPLNNLVICDMDRFGYGLFASEDIPPRTVLFIYAGIINEFDDGGPTNPYTLSYMANDSDTVKDVKPKFIDAQHIGNLFRFMQHLPNDGEKYKNYKFSDINERNHTAFMLGITESLLKARDERADIASKAMELMAYSLDHELEIMSRELASLTFNDSTTLPQIAKSNVLVEDALVNNIPVMVCWTPYGIRKHEQVGFSYESKYWDTIGRPITYFDDKGNVIPSSKYTKKVNQPETYSIVNTKLNEIEARKHLWQQAEIHGKQGEFEQAIKLYKLALEYTDQKSEPQTAVELFYALTLCYQKIGNFKEAVTASEGALKLSCNPKATEESMTLIGKQFKTCLELAKIPADDLYEECVEHLNKGEPIIATYKLLHLLKNYENDEKKQAYYHSALASCSRELGNKPRAITHCKIALGLRKRLYPEGHNLIKRLEKKLADINKLPEEG